MSLKGVPNRSHQPKRLRPDLHWQELAACKDANPNIFWDPARYADALAVCTDCPVKTPCAELGRGTGDGVWGGRVHYPRRKAAV